VPERLARFPAALVGLALATALTGCAGTDSTASPGSRSASAVSSASGGSTPAASASATAPEGQRIDVTVTGGRVSGDTGRVTVVAGEQVTLAITSDVADEVHVHGYDLTADLTPGEPAELTFAATIPGVFEVELHDAGTVLLSLQIQ
jgi:plastocyanin